MSKSIPIAAVTIFSFILLLSFAIAQDDPFPTRFHGNIMFTDPAVLGTEIVARINGEDKGSIITTEIGSYGNKTGYPKLVVNPGSPGDIILFFAKKPTMDGFAQANENATFDSDSHALNLTFNLFCGDNICDTASESCSSCSQDCGQCSGSSGSSTSSGSSGGGGGGGGGGFVSNSASQDDDQNAPSEQDPPTSPTGSCEESWICTGWSACVDGIQTRSCSDQNQCGTESAKPPETRECPSPAGEATEVGIADSVTGFLAQGDPAIFSVIAGIIIVLVVLIYWAAVHDNRGRKRKV